MSFKLTLVSAFASCALTAGGATITQDIAKDKFCSSILADPNKPHPRIGIDLKDGLRDTAGVRPIENCNEQILTKDTAPVFWTGMTFQLTGFFGALMTLEFAVRTLNSISHASQRNPAP